MAQRNLEYRAMFIAIEGPDGSGKSTQARLLAGYLAEQGVDYIAVREPGGTPAGDAIRQLVLDPNTVLTELGEALLYAAARAQLVQDVILPALARGTWVISDRYLFSSLAYQGYGLGLDLDFVRDINLRAVQNRLPDLTFMLDAEPKLGITRQQTQRGRLDRIEQRDLYFHQRVREGYQDLARQYKLQALDASLGIEDAHLAIRQTIESKIREGAET